MSKPREIPPEGIRNLAIQTGASSKEAQDIVTITQALASPSNSWLAEINPITPSLKSINWDSLIEHGYIRDASSPQAHKVLEQTWDGNEEVRYRVTDTFIALANQAAQQKGRGGR